MSEDVLKPLNDVLMSGYITQGKQVEKFEKALQDFFSFNKILTINSATSGLTLALRLLKNPDPENNWPGLNDSDEVLTPSLTCTATNWPILANNLKIKWIDVDIETSNINLDDLKSKLSPTTKVIQLVHWGGYPVDLNKLKEIQDYALEKFGFKPQIIEDCAHAFGAQYDNKFIGTHGNICVFSLQAIKHLTSGDGGLIFLPTNKLYERAKLLRWFGIDREYRSCGDFRLEHDIEEWGYKFHMNDINATIGLYNLPYIKGIIDKNRRNAKYFYEHIKNDKIKFIQYDKNKSINENISNSSYWLFTVKINNKLDFIKYMNERNIMVSQVHNRNDNHTCVKQFKTELPILDQLEKELICIPVGWWLTEDNLSYIVENINNF